MGITCNSRLGRTIVKEAGKNCGSLILKVVKFGRISHDDETKDALNLLDELVDEPYLYIGRNKMPHRIIFNGR